MNRVLRENFRKKKIVENVVAGNGGVRRASREMTLHSKYFNIGERIIQNCTLNHGLDSPLGGGCFNFLEAQSDGPCTDRGKLGTRKQSLKKGAIDWQRRRKSTG